MKSLSLCLLLAAFAAVQSGNAQTYQSSQEKSAGAGATDEMIGSMSGIKRPHTTSTPAATNSKEKAAPLEARLTKDEKGKQDATSFPAASAKIYLQFSDAGATKGEQLRVVWVAEDVKYYGAKNKKVTEYTQAMPGPGTSGTLFLPPPKGMSTFPDGKYRADIYTAGKQVKSLKFMVSK